MSYRVLLLEAIFHEYKIKRSEVMSNKPRLRDRDILLGESLTRIAPRGNVLYVPTIMKQFV